MKFTVTLCRLAGLCLRTIMDELTVLTIFLSKQVALGTEGHVVLHREQPTTWQITWSQVTTTHGIGQLYDVVQPSFFSG